MSNHAAGHAAEKQAADYLRARGYTIRELNWKTPACEIDIVAEKDGVISFVEVKYRQTANQGFGLDYVTSQKLRNMTFAAEMWVSHNDWTGDYQLAAIGVDGDRFEFIEQIV